MKILTGIDLIYLKRFKRSLKVGGEKFLQRVFLPAELTTTDPDHLAGIFAAKEAVVKALSPAPDSWHNIHIIKDESGAPRVEILHQKLDIQTHCLSIAHDGNYIIAQFVAIIKDDNGKFGSISKRIFTKTPR